MGKIGIGIIAILLIALVGFASVFINNYTINVDWYNENFGESDENENDNTDLVENTEFMDDEFLNNDSINSDLEEDKKEEKEVEIIKLTSENFEEEVLKSEGTVLIDFYADWCGPCKMMSPVVEQFAKENPSVKVCKINIDEEESLAIKYSVMSIPTFMAFKDGNVVNKIVGAVPKLELENLIK